MGRCPETSNPQDIVDCSKKILNPNSDWFMLPNCYQYQSNLYENGALQCSASEME